MLHTKKDILIQIYLKMKTFTNKFQLILCFKLVLKDLRVQASSSLLKICIRSQRSSRMKMAVTLRPLWTSGKARPVLLVYMRRIVTRRAQYIFGLINGANIDLSRPTFVASDTVLDFNLDRMPYPSYVAGPDAQQ